jgi:hypothetical protein
MLIALVPAILVPLVLLFGFAGCGARLADPPTLAPTIVSAIPRDEDAVELSWSHTNEIPVSFEIERRKGSDAAGEPIPIDASPWLDSALEGGTQYTYRVIAVSTDSGRPSDWSNEATVETWARAFTSGLEQAGVDASVAGACLVQRLQPGTLSRPGNLVGITVRGADSNDLRLSKVTISNPVLDSPAGGNAFDSAAKPKNVTASSLMVAAGGPAQLPPVEFSVATDDELLIAFDIGDPGTSRYAAGAPHTAYIKEAPQGTQVTEAGTQNRAGFSERASELWFIDAIDVATKWPSAE